MGNQMTALGLVFATLNEQARKLEGAAKDWAWLQLPGEAWVGMRFHPETGRRQMRIVRREPFKTARGPELFIKEVDTFVKFFNVTHWKREPFQHARISAGVQLSEP